MVCVEFHPDQKVGNVTCRRSCWSERLGSERSEVKRRCWRTEVGSVRKELSSSPSLIRKSTELAAHTRIVYSTDGARDKCRIGSRQFALFLKKVSWRLEGCTSPRIWWNNNKKTFASGKFSLSCGDEQEQRPENFRSLQCTYSINIFILSNSLKYTNITTLETEPTKLKKTI